MQAPQLDPFFHQALYLSVYGLYWKDVREFLRLPFLPLTLPSALEAMLPPAFGEMFNGQGIPLLVFFTLAAVSQTGSGCDSCSDTTHTASSILATISYGYPYPSPSCSCRVCWSSRFATGFNFRILWRAW